MFISNNILNEIVILRIMLKYLTIKLW